MRWVIYTIITVAVAAGLTLLATQDRGYVLINVGGWTVESSLVTWLIVLVIAFALLHVSIRLVGKMWNALPQMKQWQEARRKDRANKALLSGINKMVEGDWLAAEKSLLKHTNDSSDPILNYLNAARAAHEQNEFERRDRYLTLAAETSDASDLAVKLTLADFQISEQLQEQALATLHVLQQLVPDHRSVLRKLATLHIDMGQWDQFLKLVPQLKRQAIFKAEQIEHWEHTAYVQLINQGEQDGTDNLESLWYKVPVTVQKQIDVLIVYIQQLVKHNKSEVSESLIRNALKKEWNDELVRLYGVINGADAKSQLNHAESWLSDQSHNPILLLTLGRLSLRNQLWGKARSYFEASIGANGPAEAYNELGNLLEKLGEFDRALECYREGLGKTPLCESSIAATVNPVEAESTTPEKSPALINAR